MQVSTRNRDTVAQWYEACLHSLGEQEDVRDGALSDVPLLCRKGNMWDYHADNPRWLADDDELANAFRDDCLQLEVRTGLRSQAKKWFGLRPLSQDIRKVVRPGECLKQQTEELQKALAQVTPYIFVWRCSQIKMDSSKIRHNLLALPVSVVDELFADLILDGVGQKRIQTRWDVLEKEVLVSAKHSESSLTSLAGALRQAIEVTTDADFYKNLLRCTNDHDRKAKLISKGLTGEEIDRLLRLFPEERGSETDPAGPAGPKLEPEASPEHEAESKGEKRPTPTPEPRDPDGDGTPPAPPEQQEREHVTGLGLRPTGYWRLAVHFPEHPAIRGPTGSGYEPASMACGVGSWGGFWACEA